MTIFLTILKVIGIILLVILALLLLLLLSPVFYEGHGSVLDPEGSEELDAEKLKEQAEGGFTFHYLFHAVRGSFLYPGDPTLRVKALWMEVYPRKGTEDSGDGDVSVSPDNPAKQQLDADIAAGLSGKDPEVDSTNGNGSEAQGDPDPASGESGGSLGENESTSNAEGGATGSSKGKRHKKRKATFEEFLNHYERKIRKKCKEIYDKIVDIVRHLDYYKRVWEMEATQKTVSKMTRLLGIYLPKLLPREWLVQGTVGLSDPAQTAKIFEVIGFLYPLIADHVEITPEFMLYRFDLKGHAKGRIVPMTLLILGLRVILDRDIRRTYKRIKNANDNINRHYKKQGESHG